MEVVVGIGLAVAAVVVGYAIGRHRAELAAVRAATIDDAASSTGAPAADGASSADIERALADLRLGVVVVGADGTERYRNLQAERFAIGRHGDALVEAAVQRTVEGALVGLSLEESVDVYGPPARSFLVQATPTYASGAIDGAVGVIDDVTEARRLDRVRSDFVANVSHELRTPVGALSVLAETIVDADDAAVVARLAARMQRESTRLANTIEDLLALSRLESGPTDEPQTMDLRSVVTMAVERTAEAAGQRQVRVVVECGHRAPILVDGDQPQLVSAVANLIDNGIKYSDPGASVIVSLGVEPAAPVESYATGRSDHDGGGEPDRGRATVRVVDSGIGIPARDLERIFERFYRVDTARSRETGGTGLGLSIVRHAVLNHGGTVDVTSTEGQGSTFEIAVPCSAAPAGRSGPARADGDGTDDTEQQWTS